MRKFFTLLCGIIIGIVLVFGGVAFTGFYFLTKKDGMTDINKLIPSLEFSDEIKQMSMLDYAKKVQNLFNNFDSATIGDIEDMVGVSVSQIFADMLGADKAEIRSATFNTLPTTLVNGFTVESLESKFGITLPNMPLFQTDEFRTKPLVDAFNSLSAKLDPENMKVSDLETNFGIVLSDNPLFSDPAIKDAKVSELGSAINKVELNSLLGAVFQADIDKYNATHVATEDALTEWKADKKSYQEYLENPTDSFDYFDTEAEQTAYIKTFNENPDNTETMVEQWAYEKDLEMAALKPTEPTPPVDPDPTPDAPQSAAPAGYVFAKPVAPTVTETLAPPALSSALIRKLAVNSLGDMTETGGSDKVLNNIINNSTLGEIIGDNEAFNDPDSLLYQLKDSKISTIDNDIKTMPLGNLIKVDENASAAMKYLIAEPFRIGWEMDDNSTEENPVYKLDENGNRIPIYQIEYELDAEGAPTSTPKYERDENGDIVYETDANGDFVTDADGNKIPKVIYVYANINTLDAKISGMVISDVLPSGGETNVVLEKVKYSTLDNLSGDLNKAIDSTTIGELIEIDDTSSQVLKYLKDTPINGLNDKIDAMTIGDVIPESENDHAVIKAMREKGTLVKNLGTELGGIIEETKFSDLITIDETSSSIFKALGEKGTTVKDLDQTIQSLTLPELFGADAIYDETTDDSGNVIKTPKGVLGLIWKKNADTNISTIATNASSAITESTLQELKDAGLLPVETGSQAEKSLNFLLEEKPNTTLPEMPGAIVDLMVNTNLYKLIEKGLVSVTGGIASLNEAQKKLLEENTLTSLIQSSIDALSSQIPTP